MLKTVLLKLEKEELEPAQRKNHIRIICKVQGQVLQSCD